MTLQLITIASIDKARTYKRTTKKARINIPTIKNVRVDKLKIEKATITPLQQVQWKPRMQFKGFWPPRANNGVCVEVEVSMPFEYSTWSIIGHGQHISIASICKKKIIAHQNLV